jgi:hypothetical protein
MERKGSSFPFPSFLGASKHGGSSTQAHIRQIFYFLFKKEKEKKRQTIVNDFLLLYFPYTSRFPDMGRTEKE